MTQDIHQPVISKIRVALIGGNEEGLLTLASLTQDPSTEVVMLIDPDQKALAFRLHEFGFTFDKIFTFALSSDMNDLKSIADLDYIIDSSRDPREHQALYRLNHPRAKIMTSQCARVLWEIKSLPFREATRGPFDLSEADVTLSGRQTVLAQKGGPLLANLVTALPQEEITRFVLDALLYTLQANWGALYLEDEEGGDLVCMGRRFLSDKEEEAASKFRPKHDLTHVIAAGIKKKKKFLFLEPPYQEFWMACMMETLKFHQYLAFPLFDQDRYFGILEFGKLTNKSPWTIPDAEFIEKWISQEGFKNFVLFLRERTNPLEALQRTLRNILEQPKSLQDNLDQAASEISLFVGASAVLLFVKDPESGDLVLQSQVGSPIKMNGMYRMKTGEGIGGIALQKGTPIYFKEEDDQPVNRDPMGIFYFPLVIQAQPVGLLILEFRHPIVDHQKWEKDFMEVADFLAVSIASDVERRTMAQKVLKLTVVNEEGLELVSITDRDKVLMTASASAAMIAEAEGAILRVREKDSSRLLVGYTYGLHNEPMDKLLIQVDAVIASRVMESRHSFLSSALMNVVSIKEKLPSKFPYHAVLAIPLIEQNEVIGTLSVYNKVIYNSFVTGSFNETDKELMEKYGSFVSKALVKAKEFQNREKLITIDELTGLKNERYLFLRLPEEIKRAERYKRKLSLLFLDLDKNKKEFVNLTHVIHDNLTQNVGRLIQENFRHVDIAVRIKGARFAVLLPDTGKKMGDTLARLNQAISTLKIYNQNQKLLPLQLLSGYSTYPEDALTMEELIQKASRLSPYGV